jgi:hypothetical protein
MSNIKDFTSRMNVNLNTKHLGWPGVNLSLVQILVVVANIQVRILKAEVEKGFMRTAVDHELVGPKVKINLVND